MEGETGPVRRVCGEPACREPPMAELCPRGLWGSILTSAAWVTPARVNELLLDPWGVALSCQGCTCGPVVLYLASRVTPRAHAATSEYQACA